MRGYSVKTMLVAFSFLWSFGAGIFITRVFFDTREPTVVRTTTHKLEPLQTEYHVLAITKTEPKTVIAYDFVENTESYTKHAYGKAYKTTYQEDFQKYSEWQEGRLHPDDFQVSDTFSLNNLENTLAISTEIDGDVIELFSSSIQNYLPIRSEQLFTKFGGVGSGILKINNTSQDVFVILTKGFNNKYTSVDVTAYEISTEWLLFLDSEDRMYHLDYTNVGKDHPAYKSHKYFGMLGALDIEAPAESEIYGETASLNEEKGYLELSENKTGLFKTFYFGPSIYTDSNKKYLYRLIYNDLGDIGLYLKIN